MDYIKLSEICDVRDGTHDSPKYVETGFPLITSKNIVNGKLDLSVVNYICLNDFNKINARSKVDVGDILMPMIGTIGNPHIVENSCNFAIKNVALIKFPNDCISNKYVWYFLISPMFNRYVIEKNKGGTQKFLSLGDIRNVLLPKTDIVVQKNIVNLLDKVSSIVEYRRKELEQLDVLVKARFVEFFGMPITNIKEWETEPMNEVAPTMNYSGTFDEKIWLLNLDMIEAQTGRIIDYLYVTKNEVGNSTCSFDTSNVLYSKLRPYLNKVVVPDRCGYATSELVPLQPVPSKLNREYLACMLRSDEFVNMINEKVAGAKMPRVSMGDFRNFKVPIPPMELQKQFADFVKQVDKSKFTVNNMEIYRLCILKERGVYEHKSS